MIEKKSIAKKNIVLMLCAMLILLCGCGEKYPAYFQRIVQAYEEGTPLSRDYGLKNYYQNAYSEDIVSENITQETITIEAVRKLSEKEGLTAEDFSMFADRQTMGDNGFYYQFLYGDTSYRLDITEDGAGNLSAVRLVNMETYLSIDIRTGNIDSLLQNAVAMTDYLNVTLPQKWTMGDYDIYLGGHYGGSVIMDAQGNVAGDILIMHGIDTCFSEGELTNIEPYDNNVFFQEKKSLEQLEIPCMLTVMTQEVGEMENAYRCAYFAKEACDIGYQLKIRSDSISEEEMVELLETVSFSERAFY